MKPSAYLVVKRAIDFLAAAALIAALSPLFLLIGLLIRLTMGPPVLFRQPRPGLKGKPFPLYKFRTMTAASAGGKPLPDGKRLTPVGRFLRATSLDELPELWNVLRGEMSLVGPRPLLMHYLPLYSPAQMRRHDVRPGITGWAQINGRNGISWERKFLLDTWYVDNCGFLLDIKILLLTVCVTAARTGINQPGSATAEEFTGGGGEGHGQVQGVETSRDSGSKADQV